MKGVFMSGNAKFDPTIHTLADALSLKDLNMIDSFLERAIGHRMNIVEVHTKVKDSINRKSAAIRGRDFGNASLNRKQVEYYKRNYKKLRWCDKCGGPVVTKDVNNPKVPGSMMEDRSVNRYDLCSNAHCMHEKYYKVD